MQIKHKALSRALAFFWSVPMLAGAQAAVPLWTFTPLTSPTVALPPGTTGAVQYQVVNQSNRTQKLVLKPTFGLTQSSVCNLSPKGMPGSSCTLTININGSNVPEGGIQSGPLLCQANADGSANPNQCYQPDRTNVLHIVKLPELNIGDHFQGGVVACLNGGLYNNLIASIADNGQNTVWGGNGIVVDNSESFVDGASNTAAIVSTLGDNAGVTYAAQVCNNYQIDSHGNSPCMAGNTCYADWFLPSGDPFLTLESQLDCLFSNRATVGGFAAAAYWSSTQDPNNPGSIAFGKSFVSGLYFNTNKNTGLRVRCVRTFTP